MFLWLYSVRCMRFNIYFGKCLALISDLELLYVDIHMGNPLCLLYILWGKRLALIYIGIGNALRSYIFWEMPCVDIWFSCILYIYIALVIWIYQLIWSDEFKLNKLVEYIYGVEYIDDMEKMKTCMC